MPVTREGRLVYASPEELTADRLGWHGGQKEPVHIASEAKTCLGISSREFICPQQADGPEVLNQTA
jgi:hypothetical protein